MASTPENESGNDSHPLSGHKLCGYLQAVLSVSPPQTLPPLSPCSLFSDGGGSVGFRTDDGIALLPIQNPNSEPNEAAEGAAKTPPQPPPPSSKRRRRAGLVLVNGSSSVVHQLHALVNNRCLKIRVRVLGVSVREEAAEARAVVLVDVYLPIALWSGWQFPRQRALAASFFKHVRYVLG